MSYYTKISLDVRSSYTVQTHRKACMAHGVTGRGR